MNVCSIYEIIWLHLKQFYLFTIIKIDEIW